MAKLTLKAPPPASALAAMARAAGQPGPDAKPAQPAETKPQPAKRKKPKQDPAKLAQWKATKGAYIAFKAARLATSRRAEERAADLALCRQRFPAAFDPDRPLPLAIGIRKPLEALLGNNRAQRLMMWWTQWPPYVAAVAAGGDRYQLDGQVCGCVTEEQRARAQAVLAEHPQAQPSQEAA